MHNDGQGSDERPVYDPSHAPKDRPSEAFPAPTWEGFASSPQARGAAGAGAASPAGPHGPYGGQSGYPSAPYGGMVGGGSPVPQGNPPGWSIPTVVLQQIVAAGPPPSNTGRTAAIVVGSLVLAFGGIVAMGAVVERFNSVSQSKMGERAEWEEDDQSLEPDDGYVDNSAWRATQSAARTGTAQQRTGTTQRQPAHTAPQRTPSSQNAASVDRSRASGSLVGGACSTSSDCPTGACAHGTCTRLSPNLWRPGNQWLFRRTVTGGRRDQDGYHMREIVSSQRNANGWVELEILEYGDNIEDGIERYTVRGDCLWREQDRFWCLPHGQGQWNRENFLGASTNVARFLSDPGWDTRVSADYGWVDFYRQGRTQNYAFRVVAFDVAGERRGDWSRQPRRPSRFPARAVPR
jgi:hypothetical protein